MNKISNNKDWTRPTIIFRQFSTTIFILGTYALIDIQLTKMYIIIYMYLLIIINK